VLRKGHILAILVIGIGFVTIPAFAVNEIIDEEKTQNLFKNEEYEELQTYLDEILKSNPKDEFVLGLKGTVFYYQGKHEEAITYFDKVLDSLPSDSGILSFKASSLNSLGKNEEALEHIKKALDVDPDNVLALYEKGHALNTLEKHAEAMAPLEKTLELDPNHTKALSEIGFTLNSLGRYEEALIYFDKAISLKSDDYIALTNKGHALGALGKFDDALSYLDMSLEIEPKNLFALFNKGQVLFYMGHYQESITYFDKVLEIDSTDVDAINFKALAQEEINKNGGGCLIATATFGTELSPQVQMLRELRDNTLLQSESGSTFMSGFNQFYYSFSPTIADWERQNLVFREAVKLAITPLIISLSLLNSVDMDSETEVLGYGISLILLNVGMYFVAPVGIGFVLVRRKI